jgi:hypothetical protein
MTEEFHTEVPDVPITSPNLDTKDSRVAKSVGDFSGMLTMDLTDDEIASAFKVIAEVNMRYRYLQATRENLEAMGDEIVYRLADETSILSKYDPVPLASGGHPEVELIGKVDGDSIHKYGFDHEKKEWEVKRATQQGENFLGEEKVRSRLGE